MLLNLNDLAVGDCLASLVASSKRLQPVRGVSETAKRYVHSEPIGRFFILTFM